MTLDQTHLRSTTTSRADPSFEHDQLWLNGKVDEIKLGGRLATCIAEMKRLRKETVEDKSPNEPKVSSNFLINFYPSTQQKQSYQHTKCTSHLTTTFPPPQVLHRPHQDLQLSLHPWRTYMLSPSLRLSSQSSLVKVPVPPVDPSSEVSSHGKKVNLRQAKTLSLSK